jgi:hypothetical protein
MTGDIWKDRNRAIYAASKQEALAQKHVHIQEEVRNVYLHPPRLHSRFQCPTHIPLELQKKKKNSMIILSTSVRILLRAPLDRSHYLALPHQDPISFLYYHYAGPCYHTGPCFHHNAGPCFHLPTVSTRPFLCKLQAYAAYCLHTPAQY